MESFKFIAEIGINHNGDLEVALDLIKHAENCGCDIVKFQKRTPELCVPEEQKSIMKYDTPWGDITYLDYKNRIEFGKSEYNIIDSYCKSLGIDWTASVWDLDSADFMSMYDLKYNKIPSAMLTNLELLEHVAEQKRYTFISTGMSTIEDIERAVTLFRQLDCPFELMHTVAAYPMKNEHANLLVIPALSNQFQCNVGWSGHEEGLQVSIAAVALGATSVERHITLSRSMWGSDQAASLGVSGLRKLVRDCKVVREALGDGVKKMIPEEEKKRRSLRG
jgi:N-acetylneuraminate synthase